MMLTIQGLPQSTTYRDLKVLIKSRCNLTDFILDDLMTGPNGLKKVRIGLADSNEGTHLIKCLAGYRTAGCVLSVTPIAKGSSGPQQSFDPKPNFNQGRNDYDGIDYNDPWGSQNNQQQGSQWGNNGNQPQNTFGYQQQAMPMQNQYVPQQQQQNPIHHQTQHNQPFQQQDQFQSRPQNQGYGFQPKNNVPEQSMAQRSHVLRTVEIVETPLTRPAVQPNRYPNQGFQGDKPMTIMKDNFQGPSQFNMQGSGPATHSQPQPWMDQQQPKPGFKPIPTFDKPGFDAKRPPLKQHDPDVGYKSYDRDSPLRERKSPFRKISPRRSPRRMSPGRRVSPGRRMSPGRRVSPGRRMSPGRRSPGRRMNEIDRRSPGRIAETIRPWATRSPDRRLDPGSTRYSPTRHLSDKPDFPDRGGNKNVRPAYEPPSQAANQAMSSGGYRPIHEKGPYGGRGDQKEQWQQERDKALFHETIKKREEERAMTFQRPGVRMEKDIRSRSPRKSRSPVRREISPSRDRFKRHSPSPRSPRRSWALEKRRSPELVDAPPPPIWPGQLGIKRTDFEEPKKPAWDYNKAPIDTRRPEDERRFPPTEPIRVRRDLGPQPERREELDFKRDDRFQRGAPDFGPRDDFDKKISIKINPRDDFDKKGPKLNPRDDFDKKAPKFGPRDELEKKGPKFSPRDDFDKKTPTFSPRDGYDRFGPDDYDKRPKFDTRDDFGKTVKGPKFSPRDDYPPKFTRDDRPKFSPREDYDDRRDEFRKHETRWEAPKQTERETYRDDFSAKPEVSRMDLRRDVLRKMSEELDKQFEDVHKRAQDFHKRAEEYRREDRRRDDRREPEPKYDDRPKPREDDRRFERKDDWNTDQSIRERAAAAAAKAKKEKAVEEITQKILDKHNLDAEAEENARLVLELKIAVNRAVNQMFGNGDNISFIELVVKFNAKYSGAGEDKILKDVLSSFPTQFRPKQSAPDYSDIPAKAARHDPEVIGGANPISATHVPEWDMRQAMPAPMVPVYPPMAYPMVAAPVMVPTPVNPPYQQETFEGYNLYLCKDDFEPFSELQADYLRKFLINQIVKVTETSQWAPDFTFKGLQSNCRYELLTRDEASKNWLLEFDFSVFQFFNILVYTKEELWYERAAIWLPGHSRCRNIEPLTKLKLQNKKLEGANVGKWKFVKKIVTAKGTRVYVDMPPSSARALEKHKMTLSYELQKVNVFLKAVAIDKDAFDVGLKDPSLTDESELSAAVMNSPMPSLPQDPKIVKICLAGNKPLTIQQARKVREMLIYHIFKYQQQHGKSCTDFTKYGFLNPGYFGVLPDNEESKRWLSNLNIGKLNKQAVVILGADDSNTRYIKMYLLIPNENHLNLPMVLERLKQANQGVKGINFNKWKPKKLTEERFKYKYDVDIDIESVETIVKMNYMLDFLDNRNNAQSVTVKYDKSEKHLLDLVKKYKAEIHDTYDDSNMDLASDSEEDIVCLD